MAYLKNWCFGTVVLEKTLERPLDSKEIKPVNPKGNQSWMFIRRIDAEAAAPTLNAATWCEELTHWKRPWFWERLKAGEGNARGWDDWMASLTQWTWVLASSRRWWRTGTSGVLQSVGSQRVGHDWATEKLWHIHIEKYRAVISKYTFCIYSYGQIFLREIQIMEVCLI